MPYAQSRKRSSGNTAPPDDSRPIDTSSCVIRACPAPVGKSWKIASTYALLRAPTSRPRNSRTAGAYSAACGHRLPVSSAASSSSVNALELVRKGTPSGASSVRASTPFARTSCARAAGHTSPWVPPPEAHQGGDVPSRWPLTPCAVRQPLDVPGDSNRQVCAWICPGEASCHRPRAKLP